MKWDSNEWQRTVSIALIVVSSMEAAVQPSSVDPPSHIPANAAMLLQCAKHLLKCFSICSTFVGSPENGQWSQKMRRFCESSRIVVHYLSRNTQLGRGQLWNQWFVSSPGGSQVHDEIRVDDDGRSPGDLLDVLESLRHVVRRNIRLVHGQPSLQHTRASLSVTLFTTHEKHSAAQHRVSFSICRAC